MINNLNYYNVFYTVAKTGSISRAANQLYISQPAVSKAISNLEENMGIALFVRNSRGVALTEEGTILYDYIERALDNIVKGEESLKKYNELGIGHIRIGVSTSLCKHILLDYLKPFIKDNPNIKVSIDCHSTKNTIRLLKNEEIDIGLICETELSKNITYSHVRSIHDIFVANSDYIDNFPYRETETDPETDEGTADTQTKASGYPVFSGSIIGNLIPLMNAQQSVSDSESLTEEHGLATVNDEGALRKVVEEVIANNPKAIEDFRGGKEKALGALVGQTMKAMKGKADPASVNQMLRELLK